MKHRKHSRRQSPRSIQPKLEQLECKRLLAGDLIDAMDEPAPIMGSIAGTKWEDLNLNSERDPNEPGLAGVTIYIDANRNGEKCQSDKNLGHEESHPPSMSLTSIHKMAPRVKLEMN